MRASSTDPASERGLKRLRSTLLAIGSVCLGLAIWASIHPPYPPADWLTVEAPRIAVVDRPFPIRVTLPASNVSGLLMADLHWSAAGHEPRGFLSSGAPHKVTPEGGVFVFEASVPARHNIQHVRAIIILGPTARWIDRQRAVETEEIPVLPTGTVPDGSGFQPLRAHEKVPDPEVRAKEAPWGRPVIGALWLAVSILAWRAHPFQTTNPQPVASQIDQGRHWLEYACLMAALLEFSGADVRLAAGLRAYAQEHSVYFERRWLQQTATVLALGGTAVVASVVLQRIKSLPRSVAFLCLGLFAAVSFAGSFSLHQIDQVLAIQIGPLPLGQMIKLSLAITAVYAVWPRESPAAPATQL